MDFISTDIVVNGEVVSTVRYRPVTENTIELHQEVYSYSPQIHKVFLNVWEDLQVQWAVNGYTQILAMTNHDTDKLARYLFHLGFDKIELISCQGQDWLRGLKHLPVIGD